VMTEMISSNPKMSLTVPIAYLAHRPDAMKNV